MSKLNESLDFAQQTPRFSDRHCQPIQLFWHRGPLIPLKQLAWDAVVNSVSKNLSSYFERLNGSLCFRSFRVFGEFGRFRLFWARGSSVQSCDSLYPSVAFCLRLNHHLEQDAYGAPNLALSLSLSFSLQTYELTATFLLDSAIALTIDSTRIISILSFFFLDYRNSSNSDLMRTHIHTLCTHIGYWFILETSTEVYIILFCKF